MTKRVLLGVLLIGLSVAFLACQAAREDKTTPGGRVLKLEELTQADIDQLDRAKTILFLTFGNLEEHGPHLPVGSDYFRAIATTEGLLARLRAAHPAYNFVLFPVIPLGECGANDLAWQFDHIGTFPVRFETLRDVAIDLGTAIARKGFQNIFLIDAHGCPLHNIAFNQAAAFVSERYNVRMVSITPLAKAKGYPAQEPMNKYLGTGWQEKLGWEGHAGAAETSENLFVRSDLVKSEYKTLPPFVAKDFAEVLRTHEKSGWQGYWGDPARASKALGQELMNDRIEESFRIAEKALAGEDLTKLPVYPHNLPSLPESEGLVKKQLENYAAQAAEIEAWLKKRQSVER